MNKNEKISKIFSTSTGKSKLLTKFKVLQLKGTALKLPINCCNITLIWKFGFEMFHLKCSNCY